jgi:hypothetical protein
MTEETNVIHALRSWWRLLRRLAESRCVPAIARRSAAAAVRPARCASDVAAVERLLAEWHAVGTGAVEADRRILRVALLALSDRLAARKCKQGGGTAWAGEATAVAPYSLAARHIADLPPGRDPAGRLTALASGRWEPGGGLAGRECTGSDVSRR